MLLHKMRENVQFSLAEAGHRMNMLTVFHASHSELNLTRNLIKKIKKIARLLDLKFSCHEFGEVPRLKMRSVPVYQKVIYR